MNSQRKEIENSSENIPERLHSTWNITSYSMNRFTSSIFSLTFSTYVFYFYEVEMGLDSLLTMFGFILYAIWNAVNDPLVGYICDRPFFFTKRWGRRFPWIISSMFPSILIYVLLFTPPSVDPIAGQWSIFAWLVFSTCLFDTTLSFWGINSAALFPDKFRNLNERRTASGIGFIFSSLGTAFGALIPPFIVHYGVTQSFIDHAWALSLVALISGLFAIPGLREDKESITLYLRKYEEERAYRPSFFQAFISAFKQKNFRVYVVLILSFGVLRGCLLGSLQYSLRYILKLPATYSTLLFAPYLMATFISIPFWVKWAKKENNNRKLMILSAVMTVLNTIPLVFLEDLISLMIMMCLWGISLAGLFIIGGTVFADVIDENIVTTKQRNEGLFNGFNAFIYRFSIVIQAIIFGVVHELTGFDEGAVTQSDLAIVGIHISMALIPGIFMLFGTAIFWIYYDLTPKKSEKIRSKLKEFGL